MSSIITFYSYKGGVGRSMALANIAYELSRKGARVLIIDWDLEAPGLEKYFADYITNTSGEGLLPMLLSLNKDQIPNYKKYVWEITTAHKTSISLLHSGKENNPNYSTQLENFDWQEFFSEKSGGEFLENLRNTWKADYDFVLIDSRTGLSDTSGICTILMPDIIIPLFTANYQSLYGVRDIMVLAQQARQKLAYDRMALTILPVPTRFGTRAEFKVSQEWIERFADVLKEFYSDWLPAFISPKLMIEKLKVPQVDYFSFGEKLAVVEQGTSDPEGMGFIYSKIATLLESNFTSIDTLVGEDYKLLKEQYEISRKPLDIDTASPKKELYNFDIFISYAQGSMKNHWIDEIFYPILKNFMGDILANEPQIFLDRHEITSGTSWLNQTKRALQRSKVLIVILSPTYLRSKWSIMEWLFFEQRSREIDINLIFPIVLKEGEFLSKDLIKDKQYYDFSSFNFLGDAFYKTSEYFEFQKQMKRFTDDVSNSIKALQNVEINRSVDINKLEDLALNIIENNSKMSQGNSPL